MVKKHTERRAILAALQAVFAGINMLGRLMIKAANSGLGYKKIKSNAHAMDALNKNDIFSMTD